MLTKKWPFVIKWWRYIFWRNDWKCAVRIPKWWDTKECYQIHSILKRHKDLMQSYNVIDFAKKKLHKKDSFVCKLQLYVPLPLLLGSCGLNTPEFLVSPGRYCSKFRIDSNPPTSYMKIRSNSIIQLQNYRYFGNLHQV